MPLECQPGEIYSIQEELWRHNPRLFQRKIFLSRKKDIFATTGRTNRLRETDKLPPWIEESERTFECRPGPLWTDRLTLWHSFDIMWAVLVCVVESPMMRSSIYNSVVATWNSVCHYQRCFGAVVSPLTELPVFNAYSAINRRRGLVELEPLFVWPAHRLYIVHWELFFSRLLIWLCILYMRWLVEQENMFAPMMTSLLWCVLSKPTHTRRSVRSVDHKGISEWAKKGDRRIQ